MAADYDDDGDVDLFVANDSNPNFLYRNRGDGRFESVGLLAGVAVTRQLLEGINYQEIAREANRGEGRLPRLIGFDPNIADKYDGGTRVRGDVRVSEDGRLIAEDEDLDDKLNGTSNRAYDLVAIGAHGLGQQALSQLGSVVARAVRDIEKDVLLVRSDRSLTGGRIMVCIDGSSYSYRGMQVALDMAR